MEIVGNWIASILFILAIICFIVGNTIRFRYWWKCKKIVLCRSTQCRYRRYCHKWIVTLPDEEIEELHKIIDEYAKKI